MRQGYMFYFCEQLRFNPIYEIARIVTRALFQTPSDDNYIMFILSQNRDNFIYSSHYISDQDANESDSDSHS